MTALSSALAHTLRWEGGYVDDPDDPGGATNYGVSLRFLLSTDTLELYDYDGDGDVDADDVRNMTKEQAGEVYEKHFWKPEYEALAPVLTIKLFDFGVNMGPRQAGKLAQRTLNEQGHGLRVDGVIGPNTLEVLRDLLEDRALVVVGDLEDHAARFYYYLAEKRRASRKYLFGWLRRAYDRPEL